MGNRLHGTQECVRFYFSNLYIRLGITNTSPTLYCICLSAVLSMLKRLKSAVATFVFEQSDFIFLCVSAIHARRTICKDYVMNCLSILYKTSLVIALSLLSIIVTIVVIIIFFVFLLRFLLHHVFIFSSSSFFLSRRASR